LFGFFIQQDRVKFPVVCIILEPNVNPREELFELIPVAVAKLKQEVISVSKGTLPYIVAVFPLPLKSYQVVPVPGYDLLDDGSKANTNPSVIICGPVYIYK
jgi:hypothetical protein